MTPSPRRPRIQFLQGGDFPAAHTDKWSGGRAGDNAKPSIFLMCNSLETGGTERQFVNLAGGLRREGFDVWLGCLQRKGHFLSGIDEIDEFNPGGSFLSLRAHRARITLARFLRSKNIAIAHSFSFYGNIMLIPVARIVGVPVVIGSHRRMRDQLSILKSAAQGMMFRLCDRVVCNSIAAKTGLVDHGLPESKAQVIPNGLAPDCFNRAPPALPRAKDVLRIGMIARMNNPAKNHGLFLRVAARLASKYSNVDFLMAGDGALRPGLEKAAEHLGIGGRVKFLGERHDIPAILASIDISVLASISESSPNTIMESMAAGVAVVATRVGGTAEIIDDGITGLLVASGSEAALCRAIECLLSNAALRSECGRRAKSVALERFGLDGAVAQYQQLYLSLLQAKGWRPKGVSTSEVLTKNI